MTAPNSKYPKYFSFIKAGIGREAANSSGVEETRCLGCQLLGEPTWMKGQVELANGCLLAETWLRSCWAARRKEELYWTGLKSLAHKLQRLTLMYLKEVQWGNWELTKSS